MKPLRDTRWIKLSEFAEATGIPISTLRRHCVRRMMPSSKRGGRFWWIDATMLKAWRNWEY
jgi:hypothetical protein